MRKTYLFLTVAVAVAIALLLIVGCGPAEEETVSEPDNKTEISEPGENMEEYNIDIYTHRSGSTTYVIGAALAEMINQNSDWLSATALETPGALPNLMALRDQPELRTTAIVGGFAYQATTGVEPFEEPFDELCEIAAYGASANFILSNNPNIKTIEDLDGKRVGLGTAPSLGLVDQPLDYFERSGIEIIPEFLGQGPSAEEMRDGKIDAMFGGGLAAAPDFSQFAPTPALVEILEMEENISFISLDPDILHESMAALGMPQIPGAVTAAPGAFHEKQTEPVILRADITSWIVHEDMPDEVVAEFLRIMYENADKFGEYNRCGNYITKETMARVGSPETMPDVAIEFYNEKGVEVPGLD